jgi:hypothetical protein
LQNHAVAILDHGQFQGLDSWRIEDLPALSEVVNHFFTFAWKSVYVRTTLCSRRTGFGIDQHCFWRADDSALFSKIRQASVARVVIASTE